MSNGSDREKNGDIERREAALLKVLAKRAELDRLLGEELSSFVGTTAPPHTGRPPIVVPAFGNLAIRMIKQGVTYVFALNKSPLPYAENGYYPLPLSPGLHGLVWYVRPTKDLWAFQIDLIVHGTVLALDRHSSADIPKPNSILEQQPLEAR